jgi:hypothetical protein
MCNLHMFFHGNNAICFVLCYQTFVTFNTRGQDFKVAHAIVVDYAYHDLISI